MADTHGGEGNPIRSAFNEILSGLGGGGAGQRQPIGVTPGYGTMEGIGTAGIGHPVSERSRAPSSAFKRFVPARYYQDDEFAPAGFPEARIRQIQTDLALIGFYDANAQVIPGDWGPETSTAFARLLAYANQHGMPWSHALASIKSKVQGQGGPGGGGRMKIDEFGNLVPIDTPPAREPLVTRTTDPKTLELVFRESSMNLLGQALSPDQVSMMTRAYNDMEVQRQQEAYDKQLTGGSVVDIPSGEAYGQAEIERMFPGQVQEYRGLNYLSDAMSMLASPAWGIG